MNIKLCIIILFVFVCHAAIGQTLSTITDQWEKNLDFAFIQKIGFRSDSGNLIYVRKSYLDSGWAKMFPEKSQHEQYDFVEAENNHVIPFLQANKKEKLRFGRVATIKDTFSIPVIRNNKQITLYTYDPIKAEVNIRIQVKQKHDFVVAVYALTNGFITVYSKDAYIYADFDSYDGKTHTLLPIINKKGQTRQILDVVEKNGQVFLIAKGEHHKNVSDLWLYTVAIAGAMTNGTSIKIKGFIHQFMSAGFIPSLGVEPVLWVSHRKKAVSLSQVSLVKLNVKQDVIWKRKMSSIFQWQNTASVSLCNENFIISNTENRIRKSVEFKAFNSGDTQRLLNIAPVIFKNRIISNISLYPTEKSLYVIVSFSQMEKKRRSDGWYSWNGYRIDKMNIDSFCIKND